jgi:hypothetical protein
VPQSLLPAGSLGAFVLSMVGAVLVWVAVSPSLWGWLPERVASRSAERSALVAQGILPDPGRPGTSPPRGGWSTGPFLDPADQDPVDAWWAGLPYTGWAVVVALVLAVATIAGVVVLATAAAAGPDRRAELRPAPRPIGWGQLRWFAERQVGRRDAVAFLGWAAVVAACAIAWPSERSAGPGAAWCRSPPCSPRSRSSSSPAGSAACGAASPGGRWSASDEVGDDRGRQPDQRQPAAGCDDPPTRNSPATGDRFAGRRNAARAPLLLSRRSRRRRCASRAPGRPACAPPATAPGRGRRARVRHHLQHPVGVRPASPGAVQSIARRVVPRRVDQHEPRLVRVVRAQRGVVGGADVDRRVRRRARPPRCRPVPKTASNSSS